MAAMRALFDATRQRHLAERTRDKWSQTVAKEHVVAWETAGAKLAKERAEGASAVARATAAVEFALHATGAMSLLQ